MKKDLSIITATYNDVLGLKQTIASLQPLMRTALQWEHIVVDSSPETSQTALRELPSEWPIVHIQQTPPRGIYAAQNLGFKSAKGECVWFLNGGDRLKDVATLQEMIARLKTTPVIDLLCAGAALMREDHYLYPQFAPKDLWRGLVGTNRLCHQALLYRRTSLEKLGPFNEEYKLCADYEHHLRAFIAGWHSDAVDQVLVEFDMAGSSSNYTQTLAEFKQAQRALAPRLPRWFNLACEVIRPASEARVRVVKSLAHSPAQRLLRSAWIWWKRL